VFNLREPQQANQFEPELGKVQPQLVSLSFCLTFFPSFFLNYEMSGILKTGVNW
jgi:hypothetical protein